MVIDGDIDEFFKPKKDPYRKPSGCCANASPGGFRRNQPKKDPKTGELTRRTLIGDWKLNDDALEIRELRLLKERENSRSSRKCTPAFIKASMDQKIRKTFTSGRVASPQNLAVPSNKDV